MKLSGGGRRRAEGGKKMTVSFEVEGKVTGKGRPRVTMHGTYTPANTRHYEELVKLRYKQACKLPPAEGEVIVIIRAYMTPAKSLSTKKKAELMKDNPMKKPDIDNIAKIVLDALNGVAWVDDKQITTLHVFKQWDETEHLHIWISRGGEADA